MSTSRVTAAVADLVTIAPARDDAPEARDPAEVAALVEASKAGDREAFGRLVALNERPAYRTALAALGRREDAEEVAQDAFVAAWRKLPAFRGQSTFRTWLLKIVWRRALNRRRSARRWWSRMRGSEHEWDMFHEGSPSPEAMAIERQVERRIARAIDRLSPKLRDALLLAAAGEHSYGTIARMLGVPVGTVKWRVAEARRLVAARVGHERRR